MPTLAARSLRPLSRRFFARPVDVVARDLLGRFLVREIDGRRVVLRLVETEAYLGIDDPASHAFRGRRTARNESLYLPPGHAYVYFVYGMHFCLNVVAGPSGRGGAVLLRAARPLNEIDWLARRRGLRRPPRPGDLAGGPAKLCQALAVARALDGHRLDRPPLYLAAGEPVPKEAIVAAPRIGIDYAGEAARWPLRFCVRDEPEVSRPRPFPVR